MRMRWVVSNDGFAFMWLENNGKTCSSVVKMDGKMAKEVLEVVQEINRRLNGKGI